MTEAEAREAVRGLDRLPRHVAVIMDGNGRWARERGLTRLEGHHQGRKATKRLVEAAGEVRLEALTIYSFSSENWRRPQEEVDGLMALIEDSLREELDELDESNVVFTASGRLHELPPSLRRALAEARERTQDNSGLILNVAVNYGGRGEIADAAAAIARQVAAGELSPEQIDESLFRQHLYAPQLPDPDLVLRTGGELRLSNFLLWEAAYAELYVLPVLWPDFQKLHLFEALLDYNSRERRFGGVEADHTPHSSP